MLGWIFKSLFVFLGNRNSINIQGISELFKEACVITAVEGFDNKA